MNEILAKLNDAFALCEVANAKMKQGIEDNLKHSAELEGKETSLNSREENLNKREVKIKNVEDAQVMLDKAQALNTQTNLQEKELKIRMDAFVKHESEVTEVIKQGILANKAKEVELATREVNLNKAIEDLKLAKEKMKEEVLAEIKSRL